MKYVKKDSIPEYVYVFEESLHTRLKAKIDASIFCRINRHDELLVKITKNELTYKQIISKDMTNKIANGYTADQAADFVISEYKKFLYNKHFY